MLKCVPKVRPRTFLAHAFGNIDVVWAACVFARVISRTRGTSSSTATKTDTLRTRLVVLPNAWSPVIKQILPQRLLFRTCEVCNSNLSCMNECMHTCITGGYETWVCLLDTHPCGDPYYCWVYHETNKVRATRFLRVCVYVCIP